MEIFKSKPIKKDTIQKLKYQSVAAIAIFDKTVADLELANTSCEVEKKTREKEIEKLNSEISEIDSVQSTNNKVINKINSIFKDED